MCRDVSGKRVGRMGMGCVRGVLKVGEIDFRLLVCFCWCFCGFWGYGLGCHQSPQAKRVMSVVARHRKIRDKR